MLAKTIVAISHFLFNFLFPAVYADLHRGWNSWSTLNPSFVLLLTLMSKMEMLIPSADTWFPSFLLLSEIFVFLLSSLCSLVPERFIWCSPFPRALGWTEFHNPAIHEMQVIPRQARDLSKQLSHCAFRTNKQTNKQRFKSVQYSRRNQFKILAWILALKLIVVTSMIPRLHIVLFLCSIYFRPHI